MPRTFTADGGWTAGCQVRSEGGWTTDNVVILRDTAPPTISELFPRWQIYGLTRNRCVMPSKRCAITLANGAPCRACHSICPEVLDFNRRFWAALCSIPFGETRTYGEVAKMIGQPRAARAVGRACGLNPLPIVVPCHRVTAQNDKLGGYTGGIHIKQELLTHEEQSLA